MHGDALSLLSLILSLSLFEFLNQATTCLTTLQISNLSRSRRKRDSAGGGRNCRGDVWFPRGFLGKEQASFDSGFNFGDIFRPCIWYTDMAARLTSPGLMALKGP